MGQFVYLMFSFSSPKRAQLSNNENIAKRQKKPNLSELTQILSDLLSLLSEYFSVKMKCIGATLTVVSFAAVVWSRHTTPSMSISHVLRKSVLRDETK